MWVMSLIIEFDEQNTSGGFLLVRGSFFPQEVLSLLILQLLKLMGTPTGVTPSTACSTPSSWRSSSSWTSAGSRRRKRELGQGLAQTRWELLCFGPAAQLNSCSGSAWHSQAGLFWVLPLAEGFFWDCFGLEMAQGWCGFHFQEFFLKNLNSARYWVLKY